MAMLMMIFGLGAGTPLIALGSLSRAMMQKMRGKLQAVGKHGKYALGGVVVALGVFDTSHEAFQKGLCIYWKSDVMRYLFVDT